MLGNRSGEGEIGAGIKRRVDVNQVELAGEFGQQRWQDVFLIALDEPVAPFRFAPLRKHFEHPLQLLHALVHRLDGLKRQGNPYRTLLLAMSILTVPDEFCHRPDFNSQLCYSSYRGLQAL